MEIDDSFYNRQRYVLGDDAMKLLSQSSVYLYGLRGLGVEIAKNLVLGGVKELYLDDECKCQLEDLGSQFYITEDDVKKNLNRSKASVKKISQLNPYVKVCVSAFSLDKLQEPMKNESNRDILEYLEKFSCIILTGLDLIKIGIIDNFCRSKDIKMVVADVLGLFGIIFCDFGETFITKSESDEEIVEFFIGYVSNDKNPTVKVMNEDNHGLKTGDLVTFKDVDGMTELNGKECEIIVESRSVIKLKLDSSSWSKYTKNGICSQIKTKKSFHFNSFFDQCFKPTIINPDFCKTEYSRCLQLLYLSLRHFSGKHGRLPKPNHEADFLEVQKHLKSLNSHLDEFNTNSWALIKKLSNASSGELQPLNAFFGGIAAQEAIKAVTQQFTPIQQWFIMECECLASLKHDINPPITRYENLRICIGWDLIEILQNLRVFMVGCGAIGCELLKNMALMGISTSNNKVDNQIQYLCTQFNNCGTIQSRIESSGDAAFSSTAEADDDLTVSHPGNNSIADGANISLQHTTVESFSKTVDEQKSISFNPVSENSTSRISVIHSKVSQKRGKIIITDNDLIEKSNLNRQFLFKENHIKQPKSLVARQSVLEINPDMNIEAHQNFVGLPTESLYNDNFFQHIDICLNALDNLDGRKYMDNRCVINERPLIESGTMSTKGHVQVILPHCTENYSNQSDPEDKEIPYCTLKSFPAKIEHCIEWAREKFESFFLLKPSITKQYLNKMDLQSFKLSSEFSVNYEDLIKTVKFLRRRPESFKECVQMARTKFEIFFNHKALHLLYNYPLNTKLDDGTYFWQFPRRSPNAITFDINDPLHFQFISSYAQMNSQVHSIDVGKKNVDISVYQTWINECALPTFIPREKPIEIDEAVNRKDKKPNELKVEDFEIGESSLIDLLKSKNIESLLSINPIEFDKDNALHIDFIASLSNLRSRMYGIEEVNTQTIKKISGRIIPAIATSTSVISGLVMIELLKFAKKCELQFFRNSFVNLSLSHFVLSEPGNCQYESVINNSGETISFSFWDHWNVVGSEHFTIRNLIQDLEKQKGLTTNMILQANRIIYMNILPGCENKLDLKLNSLLVVCDDDQYVDLLISYTNPLYDKAIDDNEDIKGPRVRYWLNRKMSN